MKKLVIISVLCLIALTVQAQRCAVLEFKAGAGVSQQDVDGISAIFITYFQPAGYTMVERTQIDRVIDEQGFQRSKLTESQMVRIGQILNVSKIVVGDVNFVMNQYNVDVRVINVESGTIAATEGATFGGSSYRASMQSVAQKLASKIAIKPSGAVSATSSTSSPKARTSVEVLYGYLKIFPNELGTFSSEPTSVIRQINTQAQHGYNNWRIPTNEELSLMRANGYLGSGEYMTRENKQGIVLLVTEGKYYQTVQSEARAAEQERQRKAEEERQARIRAEQNRKSSLKAQGFVDLGLPSGTWWKNKNEEGKYDTYTNKEAISQFGNKIPTWEQLEELKNSCQWKWMGNGYKVIGPSGESIFLPTSSTSDQYGDEFQFGSIWSNTSSQPGGGFPYCLNYSSKRGVYMSSDRTGALKNVRLVQKY